MVLPDPPERVVFGPSMEPEPPTKGKARLVIAAATVICLLVLSGATLAISQDDVSPTPSSRVADAMAAGSKGNCVIYTNTFGAFTQEEADARVKTLAGLFSRDDEVTHYTTRQTVIKGPEGKTTYVVLSAAQVCFKTPAPSFGS